MCAVNLVGEKIIYSIQDKLFFHIRRYNYKIIVVEKLIIYSIKNSYFPTFIAIITKLSSLRNYIFRFKISYISKFAVAMYDKMKIKL